MEAIAAGRLSEAMDVDRVELEDDEDLMCLYRIGLFDAWARGIGVIAGDYETDAIEPQKVAGALAIVDEIRRRRHGVPSWTREMLDDLAGLLARADARGLCVWCVL